MRVELQLQHKLHQAMGSIKDHASVGMALVHNRDSFHRHIEVAVVRASSHGGTMIVDDKYVHQILFLVSDDPKCALFLVDRLTCRLHKTRDHLVALKTLVLVHRLLRGGNGWFEKRLRSAHSSGHLQIQLENDHYILNTPPHVLNRFLQKYASYLETRMEWGINQAGKLEPVGPTTTPILDYSDSVLNKIIKGQELLDKTILLDTFSSVTEKSDKFQNCCLLLSALSNTLKESFEVYRAVWEGITFMVSEFCELKMTARATAIDILKKASKQNAEISEFYRICARNIESNNKRLDYPCVDVVTMDHVAALEQLHSDYYCSGEPIRHVAVAVAAGKKEKLTTAVGCTDGSFGCLSSAAAPFSLANETKISKVWVVFDES